MRVHNCCSVRLCACACVCVRACVRVRVRVCVCVCVAVVEASARPRKSASCLNSSVPERAPRDSQRMRKDGPHKHARAWLWRKRSPSLINLLDSTSLAAAPGEETSCVTHESKPRTWPFSWSQNATEHLRSAAPRAPQMRSIRIQCEAPVVCRGLGRGHCRGHARGHGLVPGPKTPQIIFEARPQVRPDEIGQDSMRRAFSPAFLPSSPFLIPQMSAFGCLFTRGAGSRSQSEDTFVR